MYIKVNHSISPVSRSFYFFILFLFLSTIALSQSIVHVEPPHWYVGMQNPKLQLMIHGKDIGRLKPMINYQGVKITKVHTTSNPNYLFIDLLLSEMASAGKFKISFLDQKKDVLQYEYQLKSRRKNSANRSTFSTKDVIYLVTPDRFINGDRDNDHVAGMKETFDRQDESGRHGGDLKGIIDHLDYINAMGFTALWLNPVLENNQSKWSYHGYATTDYYNIDPRYGSMEDYLILSKKAKEKGIGLIMDMVANHCGHEHWWMEDLPTEDWINFQGLPYKGTNHGKYTLLDPYAAEQDRKRMTKGWFVPEMPDLNQNNPFLATYLIQNSIWWIEYADLYGIRQDTYSYPFKKFMSDWTCSIEEEYPGFNIVGEEWVNDPAIISYWQRGKENNDGYTSCLKSLIDFPLNKSITQALTQEESWDKGLVHLYESLAKDFNYPDPSNLVIMLDNHDMSRIYEQLDHNIADYKMAMTYLLTTRGIPQIYYGTEVLMSHPGSNSHGAIRSDFPGGWKGDTKNALTGNGLTSEEKDAQQWLKLMLQFRKENEVIYNGQLTHYVPQEGVYVYFRHSAKNVLMIILNKNKNEQLLDLARFDKFITPGLKVVNPLTKENHYLDRRIRVNGREVTILKWDKIK